MWGSRLLLHMLKPMPISVQIPCVNRVSMRCVAVLLMCFRRVERLPSGLICSVMRLKPLKPLIRKPSEAVIWFRMSGFIRLARYQWMQIAFRGFGAITLIALVVPQVGMYYIR